MEFRILVETRLDDRILERELVSRVERPACGIGPEEIGLTLEEGKAVLRKVQARIVQTCASPKLHPGGRWPRLRLDQVPE
jgi:hypothetical protein